jgi:hypothetical protein
MDDETTDQPAHIRRQLDLLENIQSLLLLIVIVLGIAGIALLVQSLKS